MSIISQDICHKFYEYASSADEKELGPPRASFSSLSLSRKRKKTNQMSRLFDIGIKCVAPDSPEDLKKNVINKIQPLKGQMEQSSEYKQLLKNIEELYYMAESKIEKLHVLSLITPILPFKSVQVRLIRNFTSKFIGNYP